MSLWEVDDRATCPLMTDYYTNLIVRKMTKNRSLEVVKKVVRETAGWSDSKYWAAFVLLDALDGGLTGIFWDGKKDIGPNFR